MYINSGTHDNETVHSITISEVILPGMLALPTPVTIQLDMSFVGGQPVSVKFVQWQVFLASIRIISLCGYKLADMSSVGHFLGV